MFDIVVTSTHKRAGTPLHSRFDLGTVTQVADNSGHTWLARVPHVKHCHLSNYNSMLYCNNCILALACQKDKQQCMNCP